MIEQQIEQDVKSALLAGDALRVSTLRGLKSVLLYAKVATGKRATGLENDEVLTLLAKEAKKRQESADMYMQGDRPESAQKELAEKAIIVAYLPPPLSEADISAVVDEIIASSGATDLAGMGKVIGAVKQRLGASADGSIIAKIAKERLQQK
ncbi:MAG: GatB/YqeY domain-containing protein [Candidatus Saccharibacteria bacterium]